MKLWILCHMFAIALPYFFFGRKSRTTYFKFMDINVVICYENINIHHHHQNTPNQCAAGDVERSKVLRRSWKLVENFILRPLKESQMDFWPLQIISMSENCPFPFFALKTNQIYLTNCSWSSSKPLQFALFLFDSEFHVVICQSVFHTIC